MERERRGCSILKQILNMALPSMVSQMLEQVIELTNIIWVSGLGNSHWLSGIGIASAFVNMLAYSMMYGLSSGFYTLASQAYGAHNYQEVGALFNKARLMVLLLSLGYLPLFYFGQIVMEAMSIQPHLAELAGSYTRLTYIGWVLNVQGIVVSTFLKVQEVTCPQMLCNIFQFLVHLGLLYFMTIVWDLGFNGVCYSLVISNALNCLDMYLLLYCNCHKFYNSKTYVSLRRAHFRNCWAYLKVAIPAALMTLVEWLVYDLLLILVVPLGEASVAAQTIIMNLQNFFYIMSQGWQDAVHTLVGNAIGAGNHVVAKANTVRIMLLGIFFQSIVVLVLFFFSQGIIGSMVNDPAVLALIIQCIGQVCGELFFDLFQGLLNSVMRALNYLKSSLLAMIIWFYVLFMPLAFLAIHHSKGIWLIQSLLAGSMLGLTMTYLILLFCCINWQKVAAKSHSKLTVKIIRAKVQPFSSRRLFRRPTSISPLS